MDVKKLNFALTIILILLFSFIVNINYNNYNIKSIKIKNISYEKSVFYYKINFSISNPNHYEILMVSVSLSNFNHTIEILPTSLNPTIIKRMYTVPFNYVFLVNNFNGNLFYLNIYYIDLKYNNVSLTVNINNENN